MYNVSTEYGVQTGTFHQSIMVYNGYVLCIQEDLFDIINTCFY